MHLFFGGAGGKTDEYTIFREIIDNKQRKKKQRIEALGIYSTRLLLIEKEAWNISWSRSFWPL